jgi:hypothetical protein
MAIASLVSAGGALSLQKPWLWRLMIASIALLVFVFFAYEAKCSNQTLSELRRELLKDWDSSPRRGASVPADQGLYR